MQPRLCPILVQFGFVFEIKQYKYTAMYYVCVCQKCVTYSIYILVLIKSHYVYCELINTETKRCEKASWEVYCPKLKKIQFLNSRILLYSD